MPDTSLPLRIWKIAALVTTFVAVAFISVVPQVANDFWLQAKVGELIVSNFAIPRTLLFPFTEIQTAKFNAHEWLPSVLFYGLIQSAGEKGLPLVLGLLGLALYALATALAYRRSQQCLPLALMLGVVAIGTENFRHFLRPELISLILFAIYLHLLESFRRRPSPTVFIGVLAVVVLWSNTHGSFILAPIIAGIFSFGVWLDARRKYAEPWCEPKATPASFAGLALAALVCTTANPFGLEQLAFVLNFTRSDFTSGYVIEWISSLDSIAWRWRGFWIGLGCTVIAISVCLVQWRKLSAVDALILLCFILLAVRAARFIVYLGMVIAYILPPLISQGTQSHKAQTVLYAACTLLSATVLTLAATFGNAFGAYPHRSSIDQSFTQPMLNLLANPALRGNVLTTYDYGAELVYRAYPRLRPSLDSRIDSYGEDYIQFTERLLTDDALLIDFVRKYDVQYMLLTQEDFQAVQKLPSLVHWSVLLADQRAVLLARR